MATCTYSCQYVKSTYCWIKQEISSIKLELNVFWYVLSWYFVTIWSPCDILWWRLSKQDYFLCECFITGSTWIFLFLLAICLVLMKHKFQVLKYYLLTRVYTYICLHHQTGEEWVKIWKSVLLHNWYVYRFEIIGQAQKSIKQFLYMTIEGNRSIWFGTIFPYMVMVGNEGILFSTITEYSRCHSLAWACSLPLFYLI